MLLSEKIKKDNDPIKEDKPDFSTAATDDEGLIKDIDEDGETYYFRGAVEDNYVKINGLTWADSDGDYHSTGEDMLWRIVRINGDGTIRLIADGSIGESAFNENSADEKYVGYTYGNSAPNKQNGEDSTIKKYLENWYTGNMMEYDKYIANTRYCNDTTVASIEESETDYGAYGRLWIGQPSFECENTTKNYGGEYDLKIGLITADEVVFAGGFPDDFNESYYLYGKSDNDFLTGSPADFLSEDGDVWLVDKFDAFPYPALVSNQVDVFPVINLKSDILYTEGNGTKLNPYTVG